MYAHVCVCWYFFFFLKSKKYNEKNPEKERTRGRFWNQNILFFEIEEIRFHGS